MVYGSSNNFFYIATGEGGNRDYYNDIWKFDIRFAFQLFCLIHYAQIFYQSLPGFSLVIFNYYALICLFSLFRTEEWKELGKTNRLQFLSINTHWYSFEKKIDFFFIYKIRIMFLTADNN